MASCACGLTWRMMRGVANRDRSPSHREKNQCASAVRDVSGSPNIAQPSPNPGERNAKLSSVIVLDCSIAIDPIKYIRIPFSFDDFKPDSNIIDNDGMPGKPPAPAGSVFGFYSHFMILSFGLRIKRTEEPVLGPSRSSCELDFFSFRSSLILHRGITGAMRGLRHAAVNIALGHHNLSLKFEQSPRRCSAAGQAEVDSVGPPHYLFTRRVTAPR